MRRFLLIASVAAMAISAPALAERGGHKGEQAQPQAQSQAQSGGGGKQRAERTQVQAQGGSEVHGQARPQRAEHGFQPQFQNRERRARTIETRQAPQFERRARTQEARSLERARGRALAQEHAQPMRVLQGRNVEKVERATQHAFEPERLTNRNLQRQERLDQRVFARQLQQEGRAERFATLRDGGFEPRAEQQRPLEFQRRDSWQDVASRIAVRDQLHRERRDAIQIASIGERVNPIWYSDYAPVRYQSYYDVSPAYYYRYDYDNGYLYRLQRNSNMVTALFPILGGAYAVGQPLPFYYDSYYNVPMGFSSLYYDSPSSYYRYGDGAIYGVNPTTQLITGIVALLTGQRFGIGQMLPFGYDAYNVPYAYRSSYFDTPDMWYRYDDGYIYGVDPRTRLIQTSYPVYGGYFVGSPWPSYAGYGYDVPNYYQDLYYDAPGYDYRYASGGIYQVDPATQLIAALAALVTGQNFNIGQRLPLGYDVYNVPFAYRSQYYDTNQSMYRYADGRIFQVDPGTRVIRRVILV